jgi:hypothetical protein
MVTIKLYDSGMSFRPQGEIPIMVADPLDSW